MNKDQNERIGKEAEELFADWLNDKKLPFIHLAQEPDKMFSKAFYKSYKPHKRPDYLVLSKNSEDKVFIDVKAREYKFGKFSIKNDEVEKLYNLEEIYNVPVYLAFIKKDEDKLIGKYFNFIDIKDVYDLYERQKETGKGWIQISKEHFAEFTDVFSDFRKKQDKVLPQSETETALQAPETTPGSYFDSDTTVLSVSAPPLSCKTEAIPYIPQMDIETPPSKKSKNKLMPFFIFFVLLALFEAVALFLIRKGVISPDFVLKSASETEFVTEDLNVRAGPSVETEVVDLLKANQQIEVIEQTGNWSKIKYPGGRTGYVNSKYISKQK